MAARPTTASTVEAAHVWVLRDGLPVQVPVTIGLDNDTSVEIAAGDLKPGDQVVISEQGGDGTGAGGAAPGFFRL